MGSVDDDILEVLCPTNFPISFRGMQPTLYVFNRGYLSANMLDVFDLLDFVNLTMLSEVACIF